MTTDRHAPDSAPELTDEFWGEDTEWTPQRPRSAERKGLGAAIGRWWDQLLGGGVDAERSHAGPGQSAPDLSDGRLDQPGPAPDADEQDLDAWTTEPEPQRTSRGGIDPLLARFGALAVIVTLASPVVLGFTGSGDDASAANPRLVVLGAPDDSVSGPTASTGVADPQPATSIESPGPVGATPGSAAARPTTTAAAPDDVDVAEPSTASALVEAPEAEPAATVPPVTTPACGDSYEVVAGDYWIRLADAAGVSLPELLAVNDASIDSVLVPGRSICLPPGAATPAPPTTASVAAPKPSATTSSNRAPSTTVAPAPATTVPSRPAAVSPARAVQIIRDVWPDDLEERAIEIAWRESNHQSNVNNSCCYGLFQIHWSAHQSWLAGIGVTSSMQLLDPLVNATAAFTLYQRAGGFGPWGG